MSKIKIYWLSYNIIEPTIRFNIDTILFDFVIESIVKKKKTMKLLLNVTRVSNKYNKIIIKCNFVINKDIIPKTKTKTKKDIIEISLFVT